MRRKKITVLLALMLAFGFVIPLAIVPITGAAAAELPEYIGVDINSELAGEVFMPEEMPGSFIEGSVQEVGQFLITPEVGTEAFDYYLWSMTGGADPFMTLRAVSGNVEIWVQNDLSFPEDDPRNDDPYYTMVSDDQVQYLADQFNEVIYPRDTEYFGVPYDRDGTNSVWPFYYYNYGFPPGFPEGWWDFLDATDNPQRVILKVLNYRDTNYYDPTYPYYVIGFFSGAQDYYYNRNMIHIDAWAWWQRVGPEGTQWYEERPDLVVPANYQFAIDGTIAHEYQHLIHADYNPDDDAFMNEGSSMFAEWLCGYGLAWGHINSFLATPDNSLIDWEDQGGINVLADYGQGQLWALYLNDHYGEEFIGHFVQEGIPGIAGINAALAYYGFDDTFVDVFHNWRLANLIHSDWPGGGKYNYKSIDLGSEEAEPLRIYEVQKLPVPWTSGTDFGTTVTILGYDTGYSMIGPYGTDYIALTKWQKNKPWFKKLMFDGGDVAIYGWHEVADNLWFTGAGNLVDWLLFGDAYVDPADPTLTLTTYWDIEDYWDFGFVQVSTDGGATWTSLENEYTTYDYDPSAHPDIIANLPGLTSWSGFITEDGWVDMSFDLSAYAGQTVMIGFRYMTDWFTTYEGWYVMEAGVSGTLLSLETTYPPADFMVSLVYYEKFRGGYYPVYVSELDINTMNEEGTMTVMPSNRGFVVLVVSPIHIHGLADYSFKVSYRHKFHCWR
ncbi:MAG: hypothetical protein ACFFER_07010 [Candidatus Thorarchaeota archaeon]